MGIRPLAPLRKLSALIIFSCSWVAHSGINNLTVFCDSISLAHPVVGSVVVEDLVGSSLFHQ